MREGLEIPDWFSFPEVVKELRRSWPSRSKQGFTLFFAHRSGAGKSAISNALMVKPMETGGRPLTPLDGDAVRKHLSSGLCFSKEHRDINIRRIGYVAQEITRNGGIAIWAPIAPDTSTRRALREMTARPEVSPPETKRPERTPLSGQFHYATGIRSCAPNRHFSLHARSGRSFRADTTLPLVRQRLPGQ